MRQRENAAAYSTFQEPGVRVTHPPFPGVLTRQEGKAQGSDRDNLAGKTESFFLIFHTMVFTVFTQQTFNAFPRATLHQFPATALEENEHPQQNQHKKQPRKRL